jgi:hypothetical protein
MLSWVSAARAVDPEAINIMDPAARAVDPEGINIMDTNEMEAEAKVTENISSQDAQGAEANITLDNNGSTIWTQARKQKQNRTRGDENAAIKDRLFDFLKEDSENESALSRLPWRQNQRGIRSQYHNKRKSSNL